MCVGKSARIPLAQMQRCYVVAFIASVDPANNVVHKTNMLKKRTGENSTLLRPSGHYMYHQFNIQQFYVLPTHCIYVFLCGSQNKQPLFPYTTLTNWFV